MKKTKSLIIVFVMMVLSGALGGAAFVGIFQDPPPIVKTAQITLDVMPGVDFELLTSIQHINSPINRTIGFAITVNSIDNFAGVIEFEVTGLPPGMQITYFPGQSVTLGAGETDKGIQVDIVIPDDAALVGSHTITVTATSTNYN